MGTIETALFKMIPVLAYYWRGLKEIWLCSSRRWMSWGARGREITLFPFCLNNGKMVSACAKCKQEQYVNVACVCVCVPLMFWQGDTRGKILVGNRNQQGVKRVCAHTPHTHTQVSLYLACLVRRENSLSGVCVCVCVCVRVCVFKPVRSRRSLLSNLFHDRFYFWPRLC